MLIAKSISEQKGLTLIEAAVSAAVVGVSLLGILRLQTQLNKDNADSPVRTAAVNAAQQKIEKLRAFQLLSDYEGLSCGTDDPMADTPLTNATLSRVCTVGAEVNGYKPVTVTVSWADARGETQQVRLSSYIAKTDPVKAGELLASFNSSTITPTSAPTEAPTLAPTEAPTQAPTSAPTQAPTEVPTPGPTEDPTPVPSTCTATVKVKLSNNTYDFGISSTPDCSNNGVNYTCFVSLDSSTSTKQITVTQTNGNKSAQSKDLTVRCGTTTIHEF